MYENSESRVKGCWIKKNEELWCENPILEAWNQGIGWEVRGILKIWRDRKLNRAIMAPSPQRPFCSSTIHSLSYHSSYTFVNNPYPFFPIFILTTQQAKLFHHLYKTRYHALRMPFISPSNHDSSYTFTTEPHVYHISFQHHVFSYPHPTAH